MIVDNATTGQRLADLLMSKSDAVVTTIINKFVTALKLGNLWTVPTYLYWLMKVIEHSMVFLILK